MKAVAHDGFTIIATYLVLTALSTLDEPWENLNSIGRFIGDIEDREVKIKKLRKIYTIPVRALLIHNIILPQLDGLAINKGTT